MRSAARIVGAGKRQVSADNFARADSTTTLGTSLSGHAWTNGFGGTWGINSNRAYQVADTNGGQAYVTLTETVDYVVIARCTSVASYNEVFGRRIDNSNYYLSAVDANKTLYLISVSTAGGPVTLGTLASSGFVAGDSIGLYMKGSSIKLLHNGTPRISVVDSSVASGFGVGFRNGAGGAVGTKYYDRFRVYPL